MNRRLLALAALVVLGANAAALWSARANRRAPGITVLELTEREAPLEGLPGESSLCLLGLRWSAPGRGSTDFGEPSWLDAAKLAELGFDCSVPETHSRAAAHYSSQPPRPCFVLLELEAEADAETGNPGPAPRRPGSRLVAVDAAPDPSRLRPRPTGANRTVVVHGVVQATLRHDRDASGTVVPKPRIGGWLRAPLPDPVYVPQPWAAMLSEFRQRPGEGGRPDALPKTPRYAVTVAWGSQHLPWVTGARRLAPAVSPTAGVTNGTPGRPD